MLDQVYAYLLMLAKFRPRFLEFVPSVPYSQKLM